jgi:hypothetical protein
MAEDRKVYGVFLEDGRALGFYTSDIYLPQENGERNATIPKDAVEISEEDWLLYLNNQPYASYISGKTVIGDKPVPSAIVETLPPKPNPFDIITASLNDISTRLSALEKKISE